MVSKTKEHVMNAWSIFQSEFSGSTGISMEDRNEMKFIFYKIYLHFMIFCRFVCYRSHRVHIKIPCALISKHTAFSTLSSYQGNKYAGAQLYRHHACTRVLRTS